MQSLLCITKAASDGTQSSERNVQTASLESFQFEGRLKRLAIQIFLVGSTLTLTKHYTGFFKKGF